MLCVDCVQLPEEMYAEARLASLDLQAHPCC